MSRSRDFLLVPDLVTGADGLPAGGLDHVLVPLEERVEIVIRFSLHVPTTMSDAVGEAYPMTLEPQASSHMPARDEPRGSEADGPFSLGREALRDPQMPL